MPIIYLMIGLFLGGSLVCLFLLIQKNQVNRHNQSARNGLAQAIANACRAAGEPLTSGQLKAIELLFNALNGLT